MNPDLQNRIDSLEKSLELQQQALSKIYKSVEKTRKHILWTGIINAVLFIAPLIIFAVMLPTIISQVSGAFDLGGILGEDAADTNSTLNSVNIQAGQEALRKLGL